MRRHGAGHGWGSRAPGRDRLGSQKKGGPVSVGLPLTGDALTSAISAAVGDLYRDFYGHDRTTATTFINGNIVLCVLTTSESRLVKFGSAQEVIDGRVAFQSDTEDRFTAAIERLTRREVVAFLSANQTTPGCACELFFLDGDPVAVELQEAS